MTVSIRRMSLGAGFAYLMGSVARGDGNGPTTRAAAGAVVSPSTRYYAESGTPPGYWAGTGLTGLGHGAELAAGAGFTVGSEVTQLQLWRMLGRLQDPLTGHPLGQRPAPGRAAAGVVAGFDLTFSVPKSVSTVWALANTDTQAVIHQAHREAITTAIDWAERQIVFTRTGHGGLLQEPVRGVIAACFEHWDSRAGDPHLHTHVVIANRVQTLDGRWRTLDSKTLHRYTVALSELHEGILHTLLTERLGLDWTARSRAHSTAPRWDITGVPTELIDAFSQRSVAINADTDELIVGFAATHGRHPTNRELQRLRQQATLHTRPDKNSQSLEQLRGQWRERAADLLDDDPASWVQTLLTAEGRAAVPADATDPVMLDHLAAQTLQAVASKRASFGHANLLAEAHRQLHGTRFDTVTDRLAMADAVTARALEHALLLNPPDSHGPELRLHKGADVYTTRTIFDAETRLLDSGRDTTAPALPHSELDTAARPKAELNDGPRLGADQAAAVAEVATSGRRLDLLIGPAGTGKTTSLHALRTAWEAYYGPGSVIGLAPSAAAAAVLASSLNVTAENTSKWLHEHARTASLDVQIAALQAQIDAGWSPTTARARRLAAERDTLIAERNRWTLRAGQLLIVDEASLAATLHLDHLTTHAKAVGAKVLLVGDPAQLGPVDAGGAFAMLTADRDSVAELTNPRRFTHPWERDATLRLRAGDVSVIDTYRDHGRIHTGTHQQILHDVIHRWATDITAGRDTLMIATDHATVTELNHRARAHRIRTGHVTAAGVPTADGAAGTGDHIITRRNDRTLRPTNNHGNDHRDWVRNGNTWTITATHPDGSLTATNNTSHNNTSHSDTSHDTGQRVELPADYVRHHVQLGYATTAHLAQGRTVDTTHVLITPSTTREALYVAATRARHTNTLNITTNNDPDADVPHDTAEQRDPDEALITAINTSSTDTSAHAALEAASQTHPTQNPRRRLSAHTEPDLQPALGPRR